MSPSIYRQFEKSLLQYRMIQESDRIIAGVSGIDSLVMIRLLADYLKHREVSADLEAVHVARTDEAAIKAWAKKQNLPDIPRYCPMDGRSRRQYP